MSAGRLLRRSVTGRATHAIDKKLIAGQRALSAFGGMKTSEARAKGLTDVARTARANKPQPQPLPSARTSTVGLLDASELDDMTVTPGPLMQQFWGPPPTQAQYDEARRSASGDSGWQARFEQEWIDKSEALVARAEANQIQNRGKQASRGAASKLGKKVRGLTAIRGF